MMNKDGFIIDSGASRIMTPSRDTLVQDSFREIRDEYALLGDDSKVTIEGSGQMAIEFNNSHGLILEDAPVVPDLTEGLISVSHLLQNTDNILSFSKDAVFIYLADSNKVIEIGRQVNGLYYYKTTFRDRAQAHVATLSKKKLQQRPNQRYNSLLYLDLT